MILLPLLLACERAPTERQSEATALGIFQTELADDLTDQAYAALASDARRREARFRDAAEPGYLFRSTRVPNAELSAGLWDSAEIYDLGGQLFNTVFTAPLGFGGADSPALRRFQKGARGGPDGLSCVNCHWRGGPAGGGDGADNAYLDGDGDTQASALARNPPALVGLGARELLAAELSAELGAERDALLKAAVKAGKPLKADLIAKGISFGWLGAKPDGTLDTRGLDGVSEDLVVRPFGWRGHFSTVRDAVEDELAQHHGMQSSYLATHGTPERMGASPAPDPDGDGVIDEISEGQVSVLTLYLAMAEIPITHMPSSAEWLQRWSRGEALFDAVGCASCHVRALPLERATYTLPDREGGDDLSVNLLTDGAQPRLQPINGALTLYVYSDFKRHAMGEALADTRASGGVPADQFMTPALWGLARSRPYLHDGRAPDVESAILAHGGEAAAAQAAYVALDKEQKYELRLYLSALNRAPRLVTP